jgi:ribonuclease Z
LTTALRFDELTLECVSRAGDETWVKVQPPGLAIDVGRGTPRLQGVDELFLTHGHLDHSLGVAYLLSLRRGGGKRRVRIHCPKEIVDPLDRLLAAAGAIDSEVFDYELLGLSPGDRVSVGPGLAIEPFASDHGVPSLGYHLIRERRRLLSELEGENTHQIAARRRAGETVDETYEERWFSCTGDTSRGVFELSPEIFQSRILMIECTFLDPTQYDRAARFKHLHLEDLVAVRDRFENEALVLNHLSRRHRISELRQAVNESLLPLGPEVFLVGERNKTT